MVDVLVFGLGVLHRLGDVRPEGVVLLRIDRPEVLNALNLALRRALAETFRRLDADPAVRVVVLAGGPKAFCAGADLGEYVDASPLDLLHRRWQARQPGARSRTCGRRAR